MALCPASSCTAVSHLSCLSRRFLDAQPASSSADIIPRGGTCKSCNNYILWGDVIRGCYRRREGGVVPDAELEDADDRDDLGQLFGADFEDEDDASPELTKPPARPRTKKRARSRAVPSTSKRAPYSTLAAQVSDAEREHFDLDAISSDSNSDDEHSRWHLEKTKPPSWPGTSKATSARAPADRASGDEAAPAAEFRELRDRGDDGPHDASHITASNLGTVRAMRPRQIMAAPAGPVKFVFTSAHCFLFSSQDLLNYRDKFRAECSRMAPQPSRKPHSADTGPVGRGHADPAASAGNTDRASCPPNLRRTGNNDEACQSVATPLEIARQKAGLRPFPDLPPLSPPHLPMGDRGQKMVSLRYEVVEISD